MANSVPSHFIFKPFSKAYIGPPSIMPSDVLTRYLMPMKLSAYLVDIPKIPVNQHQRTAPGPPNVIAVATPTILPVPIVAARAVASAAKGLTSPFCPSSFVTESLMAVKSLRCGIFNLKVMKRCVPRRIITIGHPQSNPLILFKTASIELFEFIGLYG